MYYITNKTKPLMDEKNHADVFERKVLNDWNMHLYIILIHEQYTCVHFQLILYMNDL